MKTYNERLAIYEEYKRKIAKQPISSKEYEERLKKLARKLNV